MRRKRWSLLVMLAAVSYLLLGACGTADEDAIPAEDPPADADADADDGASLHGDGSATPGGDSDEVGADDDSDASERPATPTDTDNEATEDDGTEPDTGPPAEDADPSPPADLNPFEPLAEASFAVAPSVGQVTVTGAEPGTELRLVSQADLSATLDDGLVDDNGSLIFRNLDPSGGPYRIEAEGTASAVFGVLTPEDHPPADFYASQTLVPGLNYIETRDGTLLAAMVRLPGPPEDGPYPTVVEYSGYTPADPDNPQPSTLVASALGYATVGVNMRGSGCSGGAFDYFEQLQSTDGYDLIETIAAQPWVFENRVGMVGISYPGISQLFVAATNPPSLAAITPVAVIDDIYRSVLYPGGIYNKGFAKEWGDERQEQTAAYGQEWITKQVEEAGDATCAANQALRSQNADLAALARASDFYEAEIADRLSPATFIDRIDVPVFIAGSWQDEQTGPRFATMLNGFDSAPILRVYLQNGAHADSYGPFVIQRWAEFLDIYVAKKVPEIPPFARAASPALFEEVFGDSDITLAEDRFSDMDSYEEARQAYEAEDPVTLLIENGADADAPGVPTPRTTLTFSQWPPPAAELTTWFLNADGVLNSDDAGTSGRDSYTAAASEGDAVTPSRQDTAEFTDLVWAPLDDTSAVSYETDRFEKALLLAGSGRLDLWVASSVTEADLEVTITEVRADGQEQLVQNGWLRATHRKLDESRSTDAQPVQTHLADDALTLVPEQMVPVSIEVFPVAHVFHQGSRLRLIIDTPGGNRNRWKFEVDPIIDGSTVSIGRGIDRPSQLHLPMISGADVPSDAAPCVGLRSQPCRPWVATSNG